MSRSMDEAIEELLVRFFINNPEIDTVEALLAEIQRCQYWYQDVMRRHLDIPKPIPTSIQKSVLNALGVHTSMTSLRSQAVHNIVGACVVNKAGTKILIVYEIRSQGQIPGLPKGKLSNGETLEEGAIREVFEETSIDITKYISRKEMIHSYERNGRGTCCFIVRGVPELTPSKSYLRGEVARITWMPIPEFISLVDQGAVSQWFDYKNPQSDTNRAFWAEFKKRLVK